MKKFDTIDIFFITIISSYFITLGLFLLALFITLIKNHFRKRKLAKAEQHSESLEQTLLKPTQKSTNVYVTIYNYLIKDKKLSTYWSTLIPSSNEEKEIIKTRFIKLPKIPKVTLFYSSYYKELKAPVTNEPKISFKEKVLSIFAKKQKETTKNTTTINDIINKLFKTKKKQPVEKSKKVIKKVKEPKPKKEFKLENVALFRKLFMKPVSKEDSNKEVSVSEIKKEQLNIFDAIKEVEEPTLENTGELVPIVIEKTTKKEEKIIEKTENTKNKETTKKEKTKAINKNATKQQKNQNKKGNNKNTTKNKKNNNKQSPKNNKNKTPQNSNNQNKKKNSSNKRANGTSPKKKQNNNNKPNYKKKKKNNSNKSNPQK